jgi:hypothetical protein
MTQEATAAATIDRVERRLADLHKDALLNSQRDRLTATDRLLADLSQKTASLRSRGYCYKGHLEEQIAEAAERWPALRTQAAEAIESQVRSLQPEITRCEAEVRRLQSLKSQPLSAAQQAIGRAEGQVQAAERRIRAAQQAVESVYSGLYSALQTLSREIQGCERIYDWLEGASFAVEPGESLVAATEGRLMQGNGQVEGILFLTDRRMLFERREKVAKKKILFITTESELVKELRWQAPLEDLESVDASEARKALIIKRETLAVMPRSGASASPAEFELKTDSDGWRAQMLRCQTGEIATERLGGAPEVPEYVVPAKCPTCGGGLRRAGRIRGVSSISCDYCGATVVLERATDQA